MVNDAGMLPSMYGFLWLCAFGCGCFTDAQVDDGKRYLCRAVPLSGDASCPVTLLPELSSGSQEEELRNTVMQLRETILQQKENISKQQGTINELTKKLSLCAAAADDKKYNKGSSWGKERQNTMGDVPRDPNDSIESLGKTMQGLKDRLENLEVSHFSLIPYVPKHNCMPGTRGLGLGRHADSLVIIHTWRSKSCVGEGLISWP